MMAITQLRSKHRDSLGRRGIPDQWSTNTGIVHLTPSDAANRKVGEDVRPQVPQPAGFRILVHDSENCRQFRALKLLDVG